ncbi:septum formation initiator family protein [Streptomyces sp. NPDC058001]|uniref:FtsB family cell division protein n=1 Tax=Streptomyces sp. NPDC058001 TaxID=3346300 RepID=UPI0036E0087E
MSGKPRLRGRAARLARLLPAGPSQAARTPFVLLVVLLLGGGLITLLMLNSSLNEGSFQLSALKKETTELTDEEQALQRDVDAYAAPDALERRARELGMVPGGDPVFLGPDGKVRGVPAPAPSALSEPAAPLGQPPVPAPSPEPPAPPGPSGAPSGPPSAAPPAPPSDPGPPALAPSAAATPAPTTSGR